MNILEQLKALEQKYNAVSIKCHKLGLENHRYDPNNKFGTGFYDYSCRIGESILNIHDQILGIQNLMSNIEKDLDLLSKGIDLRVQNPNIAIHKNDDGTDWELR